MSVTRVGIACNACWQRDPDRPFAYVVGLAARLDNPPEWLNDFAAYAAARFCPSRAINLLRDLGRLHAGGAATPTALLEAARCPGRSMGPLARTLEAFFVERWLAIPLDHDEDLEHARRARRVAATPEPFRAAVAAFADAQLTARVRARRAGTRPPSHRTIDIRLCTVRDLARFLADTRPQMSGWETVTTTDLEAFLLLRPASRTRRLTALRTFFAWARRHRLVLTNPTTAVTASPRRGFTGPVIDLAHQRTLLRRWTTNPTVHPHEALIGLLSMLHAASAGEIRGLLVDDIDTVHRTVRLGQRPAPVPLDPASWDALQRCLDHRDRVRTPNPHVLVTKITATRATPASDYYTCHALDPAGVSPRVLRSNRLADMINTSDPLLVIAALGLTPAAATWYLGDTVDQPRLPDPANL